MCLSSFCEGVPSSYDFFRNRYFWSCGSRAMLLQSVLDSLQTGGSSHGQSRAPHHYEAQKASPTGGSSKSGWTSGIAWAYLCMQCWHWTKQSQSIWTRIVKNFLAVPTSTTFFRRHIRQHGLRHWPPRRSCVMNVAIWIVVRFLTILKICAWIVIKRCCRFIGNQHIWIPRQWRWQSVDVALQVVRISFLPALWHLESLLALAILQRLAFFWFSRA